MHNWQFKIPPFGHVHISQQNAVSLDLELMDKCYLASEFENTELVNNENMLLSLNNNHLI